LGLSKKSGQYSRISEIRSVNGEINWKECAHLSRRAIVAAMMVTAEKNKEAARKFWTDVRDGEMKKGDPSRTLRDFLIGYSVDRGRGSQYSKKATEREMYRKCLVGWNAFRKGTTTALKVFNDSAPKIEK
jgi:hypothetical protein